MPLFGLKTQAVPESKWPGGSDADRPFLIRSWLKILPQIEYLNSGIAFSSSLVALSAA
jgi:hypothetical protein